MKNSSANRVHKHREAQRRAGFYRREFLLSDVEFARVKKYIDRMRTKELASVPIC